MKDVVIASLPYVETDEPLMAPALLKAVVDSTGLSSMTIDLNIEIAKQLDNLPDSVSINVKRWFLYNEKPVQ